jgi:hypothetical protein
MRKKLGLTMLVLALGVVPALAAPAAAAAAQRIDLKVLLLGATGTEPSFLAWQAQLRREGVPFDQIVATPGHTPITAATLSQTLANGTQEAKYEAVIVAIGGLPVCAETCTSALTAEEWSALQAFEQTFSVRQLTAYAYPTPEYGLNPPTTSGPLDGQTANLTAAGKTAFPYLNGTVTIGTGTYGYQATPVDPATFSTLLAGPGESALVGVFTHPEGRQELVQTVDGNQFQIHSELLRHGELGWVTRGTYLGDQRNYLEMQIDDVFLPDDIWDPTAHVTNYTPEAAVRMTPADVARAVAWSQSTGLRLDMVYNGGGSDAYVAANGSDPLLTAFQANKAAFGWINHTYDHPNLDCSTRGFISEEIQQNVTWARGKGFAVSPGELVTGEHSGLANLIPGNPGTIDPPGLEEASAATRNGTLPAGTWDYAISATSVNGETTASTTTVATTGRLPTNSVRLRWDAICRATSYRVYRRRSPAGAWALVATVPQPSPAFNNGGAVVVRYTDIGLAGGAAAPPSTNTAALDPYGQNPSFINALRDENVRFIAADASKPYPVTPTSTTGPQYPAGTSFVDGAARAIPRYPTNVYYNVADQTQLVDEYNHLYLPPWLGGVCVNTAVTTCRETPATWADIVEAESQRIFGHMMGNDPRPHYFHQTNIAQSGEAEGAVFYPILDAVLASYKQYFNASAPIVQLTHSQIGELLARQEAWATASASGVTSYLEGARVTIANTRTATVTLPLTGTEIGTLYGGSRSGWASARPGTSTHTAASAWPAPPAPPAAPTSAPAAQPVVTQASVGPVTPPATPESAPALP